ncbi:MAG: TonB-dependent receptor [Geothrix sp.]|nr:TonB-dependent receptor [Geothrix sp.]
MQLRSTALSLALLPLLLAAGLPALAAQTPVKPEDERPDDLLDILNTPIVSASKRVQKALESPQAIEVITRSQIQRMGVYRLQDVLRLATSVSLLDMDPQNTYAGIRGNLTEGYPKNIQVLIDGVPFYNSVRGAVDLDNLPIPLGLIEKIEIVRGPSSPLYGAGAVGGVIAIYTQKTGETSASAHLGFAEGRQHYTADLTHQVGRLNLAFGFDGGSSQDSSFPYRPLGAVSPFLRPTTLQAEQLTHDASHQSKGLFRGDYNSGATTLSFSAGASRKATGTNFGSGFVIPYERFETEFSKLGWQQVWAKNLRTEITVHSLGLRSVTGDFLVPESTLIDYDSRQVSFQVNADPVENVHLVAGWDARNSTSSSILGGPIKGARDHAWGVFLLADWDFLPAWVVSVGGRHEKDSMGGSHSSPRAVLSYKPSENSHLRIGYYTSARSPQVLEARISATTPSRIIPNPDLTFEQIDSVELGYRQAWHGWTFDATVFEMTFDDLIARRTVLSTPPPSGTRQYVNISGQSKNRGIELMLQKALGQLTLGGNATFLSFKDKDQVDYVYTARETANLFASFVHGNLNGYAGLQYISGHRIGNYLGTPTFEEIGARLRGQVNLNWDLSKHLTLSLYGLNLGGQHDAKGAGGALQSPILRGTSREVGASIGLHW